MTSSRACNHGPQDRRGVCRRSTIAVLALALVAVGCAPPGAPLTFGVGAEEHAAFFPIDPASAHALDRAAFDGPIACTSCHANTGTFAEVSCVGCHEHRKSGLDPDGSRGMASTTSTARSCL